MNLGIQHGFARYYIILHMIAVKQVKKGTDQEDQLLFVFFFG